MSKTVEKEKADITRRANHFNLRQKLSSFSSKIAAYAVPSAACNWGAQVRIINLEEQLTIIRDGLFPPYKWTLKKPTGNRLLYRVRKLG